MALSNRNLNATLRRHKRWSILPTVLLLSLLWLQACKGQNHSNGADPSESENTRIEGIVLIVGDGMGLSFISQASLEKGRPLALERMPIVGLQKTSSLDGSITDSAAAITAMLTGKKTYNGWIGIDGRGAKNKTLFQIAKENGWNTAVIATSSLTHATPAGSSVYVTDRKKHFEIADQLMESPPDILIGGGRRFFIAGTEQATRVTDKEEAMNLPRLAPQDLPLDAPLQSVVNRDFAKLFSYAEFMDSDCDSLCVDGEPVDRLIALLADEHLPPVEGWQIVLQAAGADDYQKKYGKNAKPAPGQELWPADPETREDFLELASVRTLRTLLSSRKPFLMMVEGSQIDWGGHQKNVRYAISELHDLDRTLAALRKELEGRNVLIVVTADHETGGHAVLNGRPGMEQESAFLTDYHTAEMVPVFAAGPGSEQFTGTYENTEIFDKLLAVMNSLSVYSLR